MYWLAGQWFEQDTICLSIQEPALLYGATLFTTLRVYHQSLSHPLTHWPQHRQRLQTSLQQFAWPEPDWLEVEAAASTLGSHYTVLRITVLPDGRPWIIGRELPADLATKQQQGIQAWLANLPHLRRPLADHKTGNYLSAWLALQTAQGQGASEAILVDADQHWLETSTGNLWGWRAGQFWTPPTTGQILAGISRHQLQQWLYQQGQIVHQEPWTLDLVQSFTGLAYSNSVVEILPIHTVIEQGQSRYFEPFSPEFQRLQAYFQQEFP
ncbi:aminotransferase class IV [Synechocystis sp. LKSZ1]|uniref:aminotransferase class IV n=1 Tax=Synechocystis sp. LKSZ1 TaxID=3144951 RepID=UPI00336BC7A5